MLTALKLAQKLMHFSNLYSVNCFKRIYIQTYIHTYQKQLYIVLTSYPAVDKLSASRNDKIL